MRVDADLSLRTTESTGDTEKGETGLTNFEAYGFLTILSKKLRVLRVLRGS